MVEFSSETIWDWRFLCWEIFNYEINFLNSYRVTQIIYFKLDESRFLRKWSILSNLSSLQSCISHSLTVFWGLQVCGDHLFHFWYWLPVSFLLQKVCQFCCSFQKTSSFLFYWFSLVFNFIGFCSHLLFLSSVCLFPFFFLWVFEVKT